MKSTISVAVASALIVAGLLPAHAGILTGVLSIPVNARTVGMGYTGTADNTDPSSIYFNPANVVARDRIYLSGSNERFDSDDATLFRGDGGASWKSNPASPWTFGANAAFSRLEQDYHGYVDYRYGTDVLALALGAGIVNDKWDFRFGGGVKRLSAEVDVIDFAPNPTALSTDGYAWDLGIAAAYRGETSQWNVTPQFGIALIDAGSDLNVNGYGDPLPARVNIGTSLCVAGHPERILAAEVPLLATVVNFEVENPDEGDAVWMLGAEVAFAQILFLRAGSRVVSDSSSSWGAGLGVPIESLRIRFDYSSEENEYVRDEMSLLVAWVF